MYLPSLIVVLFVAQLNAESNNAEVLYEPCDGGFCVPKHYCPTGRINDIPIHGQNGLITIRVDEENECGDFMMICCKKYNRSLNDECGLSNPQGLVYNVESNLTYAKYGEFPWTVAIFQKSSESNSPELTHVGGGTLIHPRFVLMAAHTLKDSHRYVARVGEWNMNSDAEVYPTQDIEIEKGIIHPSYRQTRTRMACVNNIENDIALAVLKEDVNYMEHIRPICLPKAEDVFISQPCIATGWGLDVRTGQPPTILKRMELNIMSRARCQMPYRELGLPFRLHRSVMCTDEAEDQNICVKDGGSPLACQRDDGSYVLAGITSWRLDAQSDTPGFFVNVTKFVCWIHDTIGEYEELRAEQEDNENKSPEMEIMPVY
ncbi:phenoloxidase-activating factor 2-like isoform X1 [Anopheles funestus]|uniref:phenoloxidase-activating factor 2-like isoform X1 n=1 Tax=Anopheles funestus TaxID=62324 RepID=UPI0020C5D388|nr:phenoloxidase-activating factor 2-like isoform X1 [Anopheles funestus]